MRVALCIGLFLFVLLCAFGLWHEAQFIERVNDGWRWF